MIGLLSYIVYYSFIINFLGLNNFQVNFVFNGLCISRTNEVFLPLTKKSV